MQIQTTVKRIPTWGLVLGSMLISMLSPILSTQKAAAAACTVPSPDKGTVTMTLSNVTAGTYRIWSRMQAADTNNNSYMIEVDGNTCFTVGDNSSLSTSAWTWVDYQNGSTSSKVNVTLTAGSHTIKMIGREDGVKLDRVLLLSNGCTPTGTGDNCQVTADTTAPTVTLNSPAAGATVSGTVGISATANDNIGVTKVEFLIEGTVVHTDTTRPFDHSWNSATVSNGSHSISAKAYDAANNVGNATARTVTVSNTVTDTTKPTVTLNSPAAGATVSGTVGISASASDNVGVTKVEFLINNTIVRTDTTPPYDHSWNTATVANGTATIVARAYDAANNSTSTSARSVTVSNSNPLKPGDVNSDGRVNALDLSILASNYGRTGMARAQGDLNGDGSVNAVDFSILSANWGT